MTTEQLQTTLYDRMAAEQQKFKSWLLAQPPDEILNHACEYSVREDILMELEPDDVLPEAQIRALLKSKQMCSSNGATTKSGIWRGSGRPMNNAPR